MEGIEEKGKRRIKKEGERSRERWVQLSFDLPEAREVYVAGDFNSWDTQSLPMKKTKEGVWKAKLTLPSGRYEYKLFADGSWVEDIPTTERVSNPFGTQNFVIRVE
jgi:1,4-alpha-glucan branching enzyme